MKKNQKYSKEEMYLAIELWKESGLSQPNYCKQNNLSWNTFKYWLRKYRNEKGIKPVNKIKPFIPVDISPEKEAEIDPDKKLNITITYPTGIQVTCPAGIGVHQLKALINL